VALRYSLTFIRNNYNQNTDYDVPDLKRHSLYLCILVHRYLGDSICIQLIYVQQILIRIQQCIT
jgi:hypothetical protein